MAVTTVTLNAPTPTDKDITLNFTTDYPVQNLPVAYVALVQGDLGGPNSISRSPSSFIAGRQRNFQVTIPNLAAGQAALASLKQYYCQTVCDGVSSNVQSTVTLPSNPAMVHLHDPDTNPAITPVNGGKSTLSVTVRSQGNPVAGVPVTFTLPANCGGQVGPVGGTPVGLVFQVNSGADGKAQVQFTSGNVVGDFSAQATAQNYADNSQIVKISVQ